MRTLLLESVGLAAAAQAGLFTLDVLVNLGLAKKIFRSHQLFGTPTDFAGLFLVDLQVSLLAVSMAWLLAPVLARSLRSDHLPAERLALVAAMLVTLSVTAGSSLLWGGFAGVLGWVGLRLLVRRQPAPTTSAVNVSYLVWFLLAAGFGVHAADYATTGTWAPATANGAAAALSLVGILAVRRMGTGTRTAMLAWLPFWVAAALAVHLCVRSAFLDGGSMASQRTGESHRPNIVLIVLDTVRADRLEDFGHHRDTMPALKRWGGDALVATRAVTPAGWTAPAHASFFSGKGVSEHGIHYGAGTERRDPFRTRAFEGTSWLPEILAREGYDCLAVSANLLAVPEEIEGFRSVLIPDHSDWERTVAGLVDERSPLTARLSERLRWRLPYVDAGKIVDITMRAVPDETDPVFLFVNLIDAHSPYHPPAEALAALGLRDERLFGRYLNHTELSRRWEELPEGKEPYLKALYDAELRGLDGNLSRLLAWIDERFGKDSIVIVTSDHGEELGEEGRVGHEYGLPQSVLHVPLYIRAPGLPAGRTDALVSLKSLFDFIQASALGDEPGLAALAPGSAISERYPCGACVRDSGVEFARPWVSLIEGTFKAVGPSSYGLELYRLEPSFTRETKHKDRSVAQALGEKIDRYWKHVEDARESIGPEALTQEEWERLKALGYVN